MNRPVVHFGLSVLTCIPLLGACFRGPGFMQQAGVSTLLQKSNVIAVATQEVDGVTSAALSASASASQAIQATGALAGSAIVFPPGSLALDTTIGIQEGASLSTGVTAQELGLATTFAASGAAVVVTSSVAMDAAKPFTIAIPLPATTGFMLGVDLTNLVVLYKIEVVATGKTMMGVIPKSDLRIEGDTVSFATKYFGAFQAVLTEGLIDKAKEVATTLPIETKSGQPVTGSTVAAPTISYTPPAYTLTVGGAITPIVPNLSGGAIETCSSHTPLPSGLTLGSDCKITGTPTTAQSASDYVITAANAGGKSAPVVASLAIIHAPPSFATLTPATGSILGGTALTITGSGFQTGVTVKLNTNLCPVTAVTATQITCTTAADSEGVANLLIQNPDGQTVSAASVYGFVNQTIGLMFTVPPPATAVTNTAMPTFTVRTVREDGSPDLSWAHPATLTAHEFSNCSDTVTGTLTAGVSTTSLMPSSGAWTYPNAVYNRKHYLYFKVASGGLSICSPAPVMMTIGACHPTFTNIIESEGNQNLDYIATCRRPTANTNDIPFATAVSAVCNVGWHACYPSEYSNILRANYGINEITTNSNTTFLNAEGTLNDGTSTYYFENNASGNCEARSTDRIMAGAHYWAGWSVYTNHSTCMADGVHGEVSATVNTAGWRPQGYRFMFTNAISSGDGAVCCRNSNPQFTCSTLTTSAMCGTYGSACVWNSGTSTCDTL